MMHLIYHEKCVGENKIKYYYNTICFALFSDSLQMSRT